VAMYVNDCVAIWFRSRGRQKADKRHHLFGIRMASSESLHRFANVDDEIVPQGQSGGSLLALCSQTRNTNEADTKQSAMRKNVS